MTAPRINHGPRQRLPRTVKPFRDETAHSFLRRLAAANHVSVTDLQPLIGSVGGKRPNPEWVSIVTGWPESVLVDRLHGLTAPEPRHQPTGTLCRFCAARRNVFEQVTVYRHLHINVCLRHQLWIGGNHHTQQLDISPLPELLTAQRTHHRLVRRHGIESADAAYTDATRIIDRWMEQPASTIRRERRLRTCFPGRHTQDPISWTETEIVNYPEAVALTGILISEHWTSKAISLGPRKDGLRQFYAEVRRRLDFDIRPTTFGDPMVTWVNDKQYALELARYRSDRTRTARRPHTSTIWQEYHQAALPQI